MFGLEPHFSMADLTTFCWLAAAALFLFRAGRAIRLVVWIGMWQFLTPNRAPIPDLLLMYLAWSVSEVVFLSVMRRLNGIPA